MRFRWLTLLTLSQELIPYLIFEQLLQGYFYSLHLRVIEDKKC